MAIKINCINKDNGDHYDPHEAIINLGWLEEATNKHGVNTRLEMVAFIENEGGQAYVKDAYGNKAYLVVRESPWGNKYMKTMADGRETNNLLALSECQR
ncbi:MAG: DUF3892 domain-containing protein [Candidatus Magasanikbacteria bacterium]|nr:DUF3892 domain-containing protein [Candidatus Magasanikbacteria bacterium]